MVGRAVAGGGRVAVLTGAAAEVAGGVVVAGGVEGAGGVADPHAAHRQVNSRQLTAIRDFAPILTGCRGLIFDERAASPRLLARGAAGGRGAPRPPAAFGHRYPGVGGAGDDQGGLVQGGQDHMGERVDEFRRQAAAVADRLQHGPHRAERAAVVHGPPLVPAEHRGRVHEHDPLDYRVAGQVDPGQGGGAHRVDGVGAVADDLGELRRYAVDDCFKDGLEQGFLPREVMVEGAAADSGGRQHRLDRGALIAVFGKQPGGHLDELAARGAALCGPLARRRLAARSWNSFVPAVTWRGTPVRENLAAILTDR